MSINLFKFSHGCCKWAGCDTHCPTIEEFHRHLSRWKHLFVCFFYCDRCFRAHVLDDKSTAQTKVQIQIVEQLEQQLQKVRKKIYICNSYKGKEQTNIYISNSCKRWTNKYIYLQQLQKVNNSRFIFDRVYKGCQKCGNIKTGVFETILSC